MDLIKHSYATENCPALSNMSVTYSQCGETDDEHLTIETVDSGGGVLIYKLKSDGWSFNDIKEVTDFLNDFVNRFYFTPRNGN